MTPIEYQQRVLQTAVQLNTQQEYLGLCALGLTGELGEVIELFENYAHRRDTLDPERVLSELGDVLWYVALLCCADAGLSFDEMIGYANTAQLTDIPHLEVYVPSSFVHIGIVCDLVKKYLYHHNGKPLDVQKLSISLRILCYVLAVISLFVGLTIEQVMMANVAKLAARHAQGFTPRYTSDSHASE